MLHWVASQCTLVMGQGTWFVVRPKVLAASCRLPVNVYSELLGGSHSTSALSSLSVASVSYCHLRQITSHGRCAVLR